MSSFAIVICGFIILYLTAPFLLLWWYRQRYIHVFLVFFMLMLVFPGVFTAFSQTNDLIEKIEKSIEKSRKELEENKKKLKKKEEDRREILKKMKKTDQDLVNLHRSINKLKGEEKRLSEDINFAQKRLERASQTLKSHSGEYAQFVRSMYKRQRYSIFEMLFTSGSISSMLRGFKMFAVLAKNDVRIMENIREQTSTIESSMRQISDALKAKQSLVKRKNSEEVTLVASIKTSQTLFEEIKKDEELLRERILQYQRDIESGNAEKEKMLRQIGKEVREQEITFSEELKQYNFAGRKGRLLWPVSGRIISPFGVVTDPTTKTKTTNRGVEIETTHGEQVRAVGSGVVVKTEFIRGYGNFVMIVHLPNYFTIYAHLSDILVNRNSEVREGDIIGLSGSTGKIDASRPSLLFEVLQGYEPENPLAWLAPDSKRVMK